MTAALAAPRETVAAAFMQARMIEEMPSAPMFCDVKDDVGITCANPSTPKPMKAIEPLIPVKADQPVGQTIDVFRRRPQHQRRMLADPANLPHTTRIGLGVETLDLRVAEIRNRWGRYVGPMLTWSVITRQARIGDDFDVSVKGVADAAASPSTEMRAAAQAPSAAAEEASRQATAISAAVEEQAAATRDIAANVQQAALGTQEVTRNIAGVSQASAETGEEASRVLEAAGTLSKVAEVLGSEVDGFPANVRAAWARRHGRARRRRSALAAFRDWRRGGRPRHTGEATDRRRPPTVDVVIDLDKVRRAREAGHAVPLARAANAFLGTAGSLSQTGIDGDTLLRAMTIALAKVLAEGSEPDQAGRNAEAVARTLPDLVAHLEAKGRG